MHITDEKSDRIKFVTVYKTGDPAFISFAKSLLESEGIIYYFKGEGLQNLGGAGSIGTGFNQLFGQVEIQVDEKDAQKAKELLEQTEQGKFDIVEDINVEEKEKEKENGNGSKDNKISFKGIFTGIIIGIILAISINYVYNYIKEYQKRNLSWVNEVDSNKDGKPDIFYHYNKGLLEEIDVDRNFDGKIDQRCFFKDGLRTYCESDNNYDGFFETKTYYKNGVIDRVEIDFNNEKKTQLIEHYIDGIIYDAEYYNELTHNVWKKAFYKNGTINEEQIDLNGDGKFDVLMKYNDLGRLIKISHLTNVK
jgi:hypothetical protein